MTEQSETPIETVVTNVELPREVKQALESPSVNGPYRMRQPIYRAALAAFVAARGVPDEALCAAASAEPPRGEAVIPADTLAAYEAAHDALQQPSDDAADADQPAGADGGETAGRDGWADGVDDRVTKTVEAAVEELCDLSDHEPGGWVGSGAISQRLDSVSAVGLSWGDVADVLADHPDVETRSAGESSREWRWSS